MLKFSFLLFFLSTTISCSSELRQDEQNSDTQAGIISTNLLQALATAEQAQDYRLLATSTRGTNIPGLEQSDYELAIDLCGRKYMPKTGDVIKSEQDRTERKERIVYMRQYNEKMWLACQKNQSNEK